MILDPKEVRALVVRTLTNGLLEYARVAAAEKRRADELAAEAERLRERNLALAAALDRDKTGLANALDRCRKSAASRLWVTDGRGPYEWDDDRYKDEAGAALREVIAIATKGLEASGTIANELLSGPSFRENEWIERGTKAERERDALREKSEKMATILRFAKTYDLIGIVGHLVALGEHVAEEHDCDAHGWEVRERAVRDAKAWLAEVDRAALAGKR